MLPYVAPVRERGLKYHMNKLEREATNVAPVRERGLKFAVTEML